MVSVFATLAVLVGVLALAGGARLFVDGATALARRVGLSELAIGLTVVAVGTSSPEIVVPAWSCSSSTDSGESASCGGAGASGASSMGPATRS